VIGNFPLYVVSRHSLGKRKLGKEEKESTPGYTKV
jgi:hypothetical protein